MYFLSSRKIQSTTDTVLLVVHIQAEFPLVHRGMDSVGWSYRIPHDLAFLYSSREIKYKNTNQYTISLSCIALIWCPHKISGVAYVWLRSG